MPQTIEQPARDPSLPWTQPSAADIQHAEERAAKAARHAESAPIRITEIDVPFEQVFALVFKIFISWAMLSAIVALLWYILLR